MKRGNLYACARRNNCNKLVLAQHLDDCAESFMMSVMHNGFLRTMKANYQINAGGISVIRPLVYCRESLMTEFARSANLPVINENCPACFEEPKERARIKKLLSREETLFPNFYENIRRSLLPLMHDDMTSILHCYTNDALSKSRKRKRGLQNSTALQSASVQKARAETTSREMEDTIVQTLENVSDDVLVKELARRKAAHFRLKGASKAVNAERTAEKADSEVGICTASSGCTIFD
jgi:tRNA(Ile)-lysidine synthase TilS/MesJ